MNYTALASGIGFGFLIAAQVGPIWILALRTGIRSGFLASFGIGSGAAVIDTIYCILGALGAAAILATPSSQRFVSITGSIVIGYLGVRGVVLKRMKKGEGMSERKKSGKEVSIVRSSAAEYLTFIAASGTGCLLYTSDAADE